MPVTTYCWRCRMDVPMLTEPEWELVAPHLRDAIAQIKRYREEHRCSMLEARKSGFGRRALEVYEQLTGFRETFAESLYHHRLSQFGPPCEKCDRLLRTPRARTCVECGHRR